VTDTGYVIDASAVLTLLHDEPGSEEVRQLLLQSSLHMSTVNYAEVVGKVLENKVRPSAFHEWFEQLGIHLVPLDEETAFAAGQLKVETRALGLSLGDRTCLALAKKLNLTALTADVVWQHMAPEYKISLVRHGA
jgi:PIN domain nuclease of toxin-antitoxin system